MDKGVAAKISTLLLISSVHYTGYAEQSAVEKYQVDNRELALPVFQNDITDRPYEILGEIKTTVRKAGLFTKAPSREKIYRELWERGRKMGADAVIKAQYGEAHVTAFSMGASTATGTAVKFIAPSPSTPNAPE